MAEMIRTLLKRLRLGDASRKVSFVAIYFLTVALTLSLFFELWRLVFLVSVRDLAADVPASTLFEAFLVGWRFDFAVSCYLTLALAVIGGLPGVDISRNLWVRRVCFWIMGAGAFAAFFLQAADIEFFRAFNARLNGMALTWTETPGQVTALIWQSFPVVFHLSTVAIATAAFLLSMRFIQQRLVIALPPSPVWVVAIYLPLLLGTLALGARGRVALQSKMRWGAAYFSDHPFANKLALNPCFTFLRDVFHDAGNQADARAIVERFLIPDHDAVVRDLLGRDPVAPNEPAPRLSRRVTFDPPNAKPPNVILIIMESYGATKIGALDNRYPYDLTPAFDRMAKRGILFTEIYSAGMHTHAGILATVYGYPPFPGHKVFRWVATQDRFWGLPSILREHGYRSMFSITHDPNFDNLRGFLRANGVTDFSSADDYDRDQWLGVWGVPDHVMFDRAVEDLRKLDGQPFFLTLLTTSNHAPWLVPDVDFEHVPESEPLHEALTAFKYSDWALGRFVDQISADPALANTVIVITSDNGALYKPTMEMDPSQYHIPLLFLSTTPDALEPARIDRLGSQLDILATIMSLVGLDYDDDSFGNNLFDPPPPHGPYAFFYEWYKVGFMQDDYLLVRGMRNEHRRLFELGGSGTNIAPQRMDLVQRYERRALSIAQTAYFNWQRNRATGAGDR